MSERRNDWKADMKFIVEEKKTFQFLLFDPFFLKVGVWNFMDVAKNWINLWVFLCFKAVNGRN